MIDFTHYIKAKSVADTYLQHIKDLNGTPKKQHFMVRLNLCEGYKDLLSDKRTKIGLFEYTSKDLKKKLDMSFDELWEESMANDEMGYKKEIKKTNDNNIKFYFGMTEVLGETCILLRSGMNLPEGIEKKITRRNLLKMIDIANNDQIMRKDEATTFVNGIGLIICLKQLKINLAPINWDTINDCYRKIWDYYIEICCMNKSWLTSKHKLHNNIYGLTHCIINITNYYTALIEDDKIWKDYIKKSCEILKNLINNQKQFNYTIFNDDTLAEMLLCVKLCGMTDCIERIAALNSLSLRFDSSKLIFREHKNNSFKEELLLNEHTNILYILNVLL